MALPALMEISPADYEKYIRPILDRRRRYGTIHTYRTAAARKAALKLGKWLEDAKHREWLARFGVQPDWVLDIQETTDFHDGHVAKVYTTIQCGHQNYTWCAVVPGRFPK